MLINEKTWEFVRRHADDDVRKLALQGTRDGEVDLPMALQQIAGWQTARRKLPSWAAVEGIVYPPHLNMEQCSSERTARYKAQIVGRGDIFVDLTGGFGIDFYWLSQGFQQRIYVEQNEALCTLADHNFRQLGHACMVKCSTAAAFLQTLTHADLIFLDPARRNEHGGRTYGIVDCTPNVLEMLPLLLQKSDRILLKLSPMLDWQAAVTELQFVSEVHILSIDNECKELLLLLEPSAEPRSVEDCLVVCVNNNQVFKIDAKEQGRDLLQVKSGFTSSKTGVYFKQNQEPLFLYEPNASIMKAGCFSVLEQRFPVSQVAPNSHLFLSSDEIGDFPGRRFQIQSISSLNKKELSSVLAPLERANMTVRNFPMTVDQLRKKLKLKDGGDTYIFATTTADGQHRLLICRKIG
jgi:hypothetical protein